MKPVILASALGLATLLPGCGSVVIPTVAALSGLSPLEADPAGFAVAVTLPQGTDIPAGGALLGMTLAQSDTGETRAQTFRLMRQQTVDGRLLFAVNPDDLPALRAFQALAKDWETTAPDATSGSISVGVTACKIDATLDPDASFSVAIKTTPDGPFLPLIRNARINDVLDQLGPNAAENPSGLCPPPS